MSNPTNVFLTILLTSYLAKQQNNVEDLSVDSEYSDPPLPTGKKCRTLTSSPGYESEDSDAPLLPQKRWHSPSDNNGRKRQRKPLSNADFTEDGGALLSVESAKSRDKRRLIGRLTDQRRWLSKADIEQGVTRIIEPRTMAEVDASLPLTNMRRLHDILDGLEVRKRLPIAVTETEDTRFLWDEPRKDGQIWSQVPCPTPRDVCYRRLTNPIKGFALGSCSSKIRVARS